MDTDLRDDMLKLVRYKVLFVKREHEHAFPEKEDLVSDNMDGSAFTAWKIAEFIQELGRGETPVPTRWRDKGFPEAECVRDGKLIGLKEEDKKYLRIFYEVLDRYPREKFKYEEQQIRVLEQIRENLSRKPKPGAGLADPYDEIMARLNLSKDAFEKWRDGFQRHANTLGRDIAHAFNQYRSVGHFEADEVTPAQVRKAIGQTAPEFHRRIYDMFTGPAEGDLRLYHPHPEGPPTEIAVPGKVHSIWGEVREQSGEFKQRITGANKEYVDPDDLPKVVELLEKEQVDLIFNAYTKDLGMVSWSIFYQNHRNQLRSIGYEIAEKKLMWVNQLLDPDLKPTLGPLPSGGNVRENQFVLSIDAERVIDGERRFEVYAMHLDLNFEEGRATFAGPILKMLNKVVALPSRS